MILSDVGIREALARGTVKIAPLCDGAIRPASVCCHLGAEVLLFGEADAPIDVLDSGSYPVMQSVGIDEHAGYVIPPKQLVLAATVESVGLSRDVAGLVSNISGLARLGLSVALSSHVAPGFGEFDARPLTLEVSNGGINPVRIRRGMRICHLVLVRVTPTASTGYDALFPTKYRVNAPQGSQYSD